MNKQLRKSFYKKKKKKRRSDNETQMESSIMCTTCSMNIKSVKILI